MKKIPMLWWTLCRSKLFLEFISLSVICLQDSIVSLSKYAHLFVTYVACFSPTILILSYELTLLSYLRRSRFESRIEPAL